MVIGVVHCHGPTLKGPAISLSNGSIWGKREDAIFVRFKRPVA